MTTHLLPDDVVHTRTTARFDEASVPPGLLGAHRVADHNWAVLTVYTGELGFVFDDDPTGQRRLTAGDTQVIPPRLVHHLVVDGPVTFDVAFHRRAGAEPQN